ncbi:ASCH domain-containing protein [Croceicoccus marinus]|uniref:ASCH domain-containing protein n=1 Tax=Croceicoccus marinus TaxID=450378 RepID=A0A1Z1F804_9SPHN|nr:ASCH domain-containing protein [Croceicoccus marinus]ARU14865.1 ASCH domain-containing protein [Croceicoccus marinus]
MPESLASLKARYGDAETFVLGDSRALCEHLIGLVRQGRKTASTGALRDFEQGEAMPRPGRTDIVLDWSGDPALVVRTIEVRRCTFAQVTEEMALAEGEDDSLAAWREGHRRYFERTGGFSPDMDIVWERFMLVEDLG